MKKKILVFLVALIMAIGVVGGVMTAFAADYSIEVENGNEAAGYAYGRTQTEIETALKAKVTALNAQITEITKDITAEADKLAKLEDEYKKGNLLAYSNKNGGIINSDNNRSKFKNWDGRPVADLKFINSGYNGWGDNYVAWLQYNGVTDKAVIVSGKFADAYKDYGKIGSAIDDKFRVYDNGASGSYTEYQNFSNAYVKSVNGGNAVVVIKKNIKLTNSATASSQAERVEEIEANTNAAGYVGAATQTIIKNSGLSGKDLYKTFVDAYNRYKTNGINVGYHFTLVKNDFGMDCQSFRHGDSSASPWDGDPNGDRARWSLLAFNPELGEVFLVKDEFFYVRENGGDLKDAARSLGAPNGDSFTFEGNRYQNYIGGYIKANGETAANANAAEVVKGKKISSTGEVSDIALNDKIGYISKGVTIPEGYTSETFKAAFVAAYAAQVKDFKLAGITLVENNNGIIAQVYTNDKKESVALAYDKVNKAVRYLGVGAYKAFSQSTGLGCPVTDSIKVAEGTDTLPAVFAQGFENGYIKVMITTQVDLDDDGNVIEFKQEMGTVTVGAVYDAAKGTFTSTNYSEDINKVDASVSNAYDFLEIPSADDLKVAFKKAYNDAFAIGFSAGIPSPEGILWWTTSKSGVVKLTFKGGNGNANFWGDNTLMTYDCDNKVVRITTGSIGTIYANEGASGNGWATTEMMINTKTGTIVQQFNISDSDVKDRKVYITVPGGDTSKTAKVTGIYDFDANKEGGEWVEYLSQFGGNSISSKPVNVETSYKVNDEISIDFSKFINNPSKYTVKFEIGANGVGAVNEKGTFTYKATEAGKKEVEVIAYTAFDKVTLKVTLDITGTNGGGDGEKPAEKGGCGSNIINSVSGAFSGAAIILTLGAFAIFALRRSKKSEK